MLIRSKVWTSVLVDYSIYFFVCIRKPWTECVADSIFMMKTKQNKTKHNKNKTEKNIQHNFKFSVLFLFGERVAKEKKKSYFYP